MKFQSKCELARSQSKQNMTADQNTQLETIYKKLDLRLSEIRDCICLSLASASGKNSSY